MQVAGIPTPVFPLTHVGPYLDGYFMADDGTVWSTRGRAGPGRLQGSQTPSGRYYTLNKRTYRADVLWRQVRQHRDFARHTTANEPTTIAQPAVDEGRVRSVRAGVASKGYLLATLTPNGKLVFGTEPVFHVSEATAKAEAERVAGLTGAEVVMLKVVGKVKVQKAVWE